MQLQNFFAQDVNGNIVPGAACTLFLAGTTTLATGLQDASGNPLSNPFTANANGLASVSAPQGLYDLQMVSGLLTNKIQIQFIDALRVAADASAAAASAASAAALTARFLGPKSSDPTVRDNGQPLAIGDTYFNTTTSSGRSYAGSGVWVAFATSSDISAATASIKSDYADTTNLDKGAAMIGRGWQAAKTIAQLKTLKTTGPSKWATTGGFYAVGDGGNALYFVPDDPTGLVADEMIIFQANDGGLWQLNHNTTLNAKVCGLRGRGTAYDDTAQWQKMINYAQTFQSAYGCAITYPRGDYTHTALTIPGGQVEFVAEGDVRFIKTTTTGNGIVVGNTGSRVYGFSMRGIALTNSVAGTSGTSLVLKNVGQVRFQRIETASFPAKPFNGVSLENVVQATFDDCSFSTCVGEGFRASDSVDVYHNMCRADANGTYGFVYNTCSGVYPTQCTAFGNGNTGMLYDNTYPSPVSADGNAFYFPVSCISDSSGSHNWVMNGVTDSEITACWASSQTGTSADRSGFAVNGCVDVDFTNCRAINNNGNGMIVVGNSNITIIGGQYARNGVVTGGTERDGIHITSGSSVVMGQVKAIGGMVSSPQRYGIKVDSGVALLDMTGVTMTGNATAPYLIPSIPAIFKESNNITGESTEIASASTLLLPKFGSVFGVTGTTTINGISDFYNGRIVKLIMRAACTIGDTGTLKLNGNLVGAANTTLSMISDGTNWYETSRSANG